ncbi:beta-propeller domain-containing protein, methanol dehydrogenase [Clostridium novyi]|uniref:TPM domain-containing protein n=1 Tax=Clostridium novyi TaxID=1542 RepID=UPI000EA3CCF2|nr:TPM domain-containing protein [Clostridium novyi]AYF54651.1 beta-propeller domain-containing protein, methanol dehydrogenase [Clostridium novyi]
MRKYKRRLISLLFPLLMIMLSCIIPFKSANAEIKFPVATNLKYVNDYAGILDSNTKEYLVSVGNELETKTGAQCIIVIVNSIEDYDIRDYGNKLFRKWGIGQKEKNNGLLVLVSIKDKKWSVEVGRKLEGAIPDTLSNRIMNNIAVEEFKKGNYNQGLKKAYSVFVDIIAKEYGVTLEKNETLNFKYTGNEEKRNFIPLSLLGLILIDIIFNKARVIRFILKLLLYNSYFGGGNGGGFGGGSSGNDFGGFGGGDSGGGGSSGGW